MSKILNILIIDDHPMIIDGFIRALESISKKDTAFKFQVDTADSCKSANDKIEKAVAKQTIDLVFLDINLPAYEEKRIFSGEDLGEKIRELLPKVKILILTSINNNFKISNILKNVNPDGFLIKNDVNHRNLEEAILTTINEPPYYSKSALQFLRKQSSHHFELEDIDKELLYQLSRGKKTKSLPDILYFSLATIERRKKHLKELFNVEKGDDNDLIEDARDQGFI